MRMNVVLSTCLAITACGGPEAIMTPVAPEVEEPTQPLVLRRLHERPSCFLPIVVIGDCANDACRQAREFNRTRDEQAHALLEPYVALSEAIAKDPLAESWEAAQYWEEPSIGQTDLMVTAEERGVATGTFEIYIHHHGTLASGGPFPEEVDEYDHQYGAYTPNFSLIDLGEGVVRWTEWAIDISGGFFRGCDPDTKISFDQRMNDDGVFDLYCWDDSGNRVDCEGADLWPTKLEN